MINLIVMPLDDECWRNCFPLLNKKLTKTDVASGGQFALKINVVFFSISLGDYVRLIMSIIAPTLINNVDTSFLKCL